MEEFLGRIDSEIILSIYNSEFAGNLSMSDIARKNNKILSDVHKPLMRLIGAGILSCRSSGRCKYVCLTDKGRRVADGLLAIRHA